jgi:hypothetical protein
METKEEEVPDEELNPYPRSKKKKKKLDFLTIREVDEDGNVWISDEGEIKKEVNENMSEENAEEKFQRQILLERIGNKYGFNSKSYQLAGKLDLQTLGEVARLSAVLKKESRVGGIDSKGNWTDE